MTRIVRRPVDICSWADGEPAAFCDGGQVVRITAVIDRWLEMGEWWNGEGEHRVLRVVTEELGIYDLECYDGRWQIYRVWD